MMQLRIMCVGIGMESRVIWFFVCSNGTWKASSTRENLAREYSNLEWTIDELRTSIAREIHILEAGLCTPSSPTEDHQQSPMVNTLFHAGATGQTRKPICVFCKGEYSATHCDVISEQSKRN